jgi:basic membrane protein A and related proteins
MHRLSTAAFSAIPIAALIACSGGEQTGRENRDFKVALLTPGPISDQSWNAGAYQGLIAIRDSLGAHTSHIQTKTPAEFEENFRQYGTQGYHVVFGHGFEFQDAARRVAPAHPNTVYIVTSGYTAVGDNVAGMRFAFSDASYLAGLIAGTMTRSNLIGAIGGQELPPVRESFDAFSAGARKANPAVRVITAYLGSWDDVSAGKEQALAQIARGVDIIFQNADAAGLGVFQAARETRRALVFGSNSDQNHIAPEVTIGSVVIDLPQAFLLVAREVKEERFQPRIVELGAEARVVTFVFNPAMIDRIPADLRLRVDSLQALMFSGRFSPGATAVPR